MVHRGYHRHHRFAVGKRQNRNLRSGQKFFDDDAAAAFAENLILHHGAYRVPGFFDCFRDHNAFTECQSVRLNDDRRFGSFQIGDRCRRITEGLVRCGRNLVFFHQIFGKRLAAFDDRRFFIRSEGFDAARPQQIHRTHDQRIVRCDNCQIDLLLHCEFRDFFNFLGADIHAYRVGSDAAVAGQCVNGFDALIFFEFFDDGVLSAAAADYHNIHVSLLLHSF